MKNTNKNMLYTFWSGAILLCLALVAVVLVFTNAVGNTHASKPQNDPAAAVTPTPTPQVNPITPIQSSAALAQTEDKGSTYVDQIYFLGDKSLKVPPDGVDAHRQGRQNAGLGAGHRLSARLVARHGEIQIPRDRQQRARR